MKDFFLVFDQGSSSSKSFLIDINGNIQVEARRSLSASSPKPGYWEYDAAEIWSGQREAALEVVSHLPPGGRIIGLGIANQRSTIVLWDAESSRPLCKAPSWQDVRAIDIVNDLIDAAPRIEELTGLKLTPYYTVSKLKWLLDEIPGARELAARGRLRWGTVNTWLIWNLTGGKVWATDHSNAARTLMMNLNTLKWDDELKEIFGLSGFPLPEILPTCHRFGDTVIDGIKIPIYASVGDQQAALLGQGAFTRGDSLINLGTLGAVLVMIGDKPVARDGLLLSVAYSRGDKAQYLLEGTVNAAGNLFNWLRDNLEILKPDEHGKDIDALCRRAGERIFFFPALVGLAAPHWRQDVSCNFLGLSRSSGRADLVRAAVESISFSIAEIFAELGKEPAVPVSQVSIGGGLANINYLLQFSANLLGRPLYQSQQQEVTAKGAALLAGLASGRLESENSLETWRRHGRVFEPQLDSHEINNLMNSWGKSLELSIEWHRVSQS
jgi:glycerol kinase